MLKKCMVAPLSNISDVCGTFALVIPLLPFQLILGIICWLVDSIMAITYSMFCPTQANGLASYVRRIDDFWFSTTLSLLLLGRKENEFIPSPDKNPTLYFCS